MNFTLNLPTEPWSLPQLLELVCTRPKMFVEDGSFRMAAVFIDGYTSAIQHVSGSETTEWGGFRIWLADRCYKSHGIDRNLGWASYISKLYPDDRTRFEQLPGLFAEYRSWVETGNDPQAFYAQWLA